MSREAAADVLSTLSAPISNSRSHPCMPDLAYLAKLVEDGHALHLLHLAVQAAQGGSGPQPPHHLEQQLGLQTGWIRSWPKFCLAAVQCPANSHPCRHMRAFQSTRPS